MAREVVHQAVRADGSDRVVITRCGQRLDWHDRELPSEVEVWRGSVTCSECLSGAPATVTP